MMGYVMVVDLNAGMALTVALENQRVPKPCPNTESP